MFGPDRPQRREILDNDGLPLPPRTDDAKITVEIGGSGNRVLTAPCGCWFVLEASEPKTHINWGCSHYRGMYVVV